MRTFIRKGLVPAITLGNLSTHVNPPAAPINKIAGFSVDTSAAADGAALTYSESEDAIIFSFDDERDWLKSYPTLHS